VEESSFVGLTRNAASISVSEFAAMTDAERLYLPKSTRKKLRRRLLEYQQTAATLQVSNTSSFRAEIIPATTRDFRDNSCGLVTTTTEYNLEDGELLSGDE
jgi:hypothetical protein